MNPSKDYRRVCAGWNTITLATLFEGDDHLLQAKGVFIRVYRRYFFEDIEALTWRKTILPVVLLSVFAGLWLLPFALLLAFGARAWSLLMLLPSGVTLARLVWVLSGGGYCVTRIHTAVQSDVIAAAPTAAKARKVAEALDRRIGPTLETDVPPPAP